MQQYEPRGLESFQAEVSKIADLGRYEDAYIAHVAEGETVVPMEVLDSNPRLKAMLFNQMLDMGINPERYIVGNEFNSINPVTGQPEFFLKKIFKGAKKALKSIAPYAGTIAGIMGAGPVYSALIGAGVPLLAGQDAGAAIAGGLGGYGAGRAFGSAFGSNPNYALEGIFSGDTKIGDAFTRVGENLGFVQDSAGLSAEAARELGLKEGTPIGQVPKESLELLTEAGIDAKAKSGMNFGALANTAALAAPALYAMSQPEDLGSMEDRFPGFYNIYPKNTYFGQFGNRMPNINDPINVADGGIMDLEYMDKYAMGGEFPRRQGQISGPGGPKDDLVPAMLSDGEFVMTAKAVENAGGPRVMYNLMNSLDPESSRGVGIA